MNGVSLQHVTHSQAVEMLREASSPVRIAILRENPEAIFTTTEGATIVSFILTVTNSTDFNILYYSGRASLLRVLRLMLLLMGA